MTAMTRFGAMTLLVAMISGEWREARADLIIDVTQSGNDVVFQTEAGGTLNLSGLRYQYSQGNSGTNIDPKYALVANLSTTNTNMDVYTGFTSAPSSFGTGSGTYGSGTGTLFAIYNSDYLEVQSGFTGGAVSFTDTYSNATFSSLGLATGSYTWTWSSDSVVLNIGTAAVPEPSSLFLCGLAMAAAGLAYARRRIGRRRAVVA